MPSPQYPSRNGIGISDFSRINTTYDEEQPLAKPRRQNWRQLAECRDVGPERVEAVFFPKYGRNHPGPNDRYAEARALCAACPVRPACLKEALHEEGGYPQGFRAGLTHSQRLKVFREQKQQGLVDNKKRIRNTKPRNQK